MNPMRMALLSFLVIPACDSPGGGGGGVIIDCTRTPELPICQADTVAGDTVGGGSDATNTTGTSAPDSTGGNGETQVPLDTTPTEDTFVPPDTAPPACETNARRCTGNSVQLCSGGNWLTVDDCGSDTCENGSCIVQALICEDGDRRCSGASVEICDNNAWVFQQTCPSGCSAGTCQTAQGSADCNALLDCGNANGCFESAPPADAACFGECLATGSTTGRNEASALITCFDGCDWDATCAYETCSPRRAACFFASTGSGDCAAIDTCSSSCTVESCITDCYESGTATAQADYLWLIACAGLYCDLSDSACVGQVFSAGEPCEGAYSSCFN